LLAEERGASATSSASFTSRRLGGSRRGRAELKDKVQPAYVVAGRSGPDHAPNFVIEVRIPGHEPQRGEGPTKRDAEQDAAERMLQRLGVWQE
jgi:dsRNA-specific ribonuclease